MKILIWDFNGTILDDVRLCHQIEQDMLEERGMRTFTLEEYRNMFCFPVINYYYKMGYDFSRESYDDVSEEFNKAYDAGFDSCSLMPGFQETIQNAIYAGYENVILSASRQDKLLLQCEKLGITSYFSELLGTDNLYGGSKIHVAHAFMERRKLKPEECMYIGDSLHDMETAHAIGIRNVWLIDRGHQSFQALKQGCDKVVHSFEEIDFR